MNESTCSIKRPFFQSFLVPLPLQAYGILPYLVNRVGDPKDAVRKGVRGIFSLVCKVLFVTMCNYIMVQYYRIAISEDN